MSVERPDNRGKKVKKIGGQQRHRVGVAQVRLPPRPIGVHQRQIPFLHRLRLHPLHRQMDVEDIPPVERVGAEHERQHRCQQQQQRGKHVEKEESLGQSARSSPQTEVLFEWL